MKSRKIMLSILLIFSSFLLFADGNLEQLLDQAMEANPEISAVEFQIKALTEKEIFVQKLMDPMIAIEYSNVPYDTWKLDENPMSGIQLKLMQTIPFPGKNSKRKAVVESEGQIKKQELAELKLQLKDKL
jgi:cobalt-zinc-cadmium efflux system outer membrane protein